MSGTRPPLDLEALAAVLGERRQADPGVSYTASLHHQGRDAILKKIVEETFEVTLAARDGDPDHLVYEIADLWFHTLVLLSHEDLGPREVLEELARRFGTSGIEEKAGRKKS